MKYVNIISFVIDSLNRRIVKFLGSGKADTQTAIEIGPYGIDSAPIKGMVAVYGPTTTDGKSVIIGYLNVSQLAEAGEFRCYSTNNAGVEKFSFHLKNTGVAVAEGEEMQLLGNAHTLVRYIPINAGLQAEASLINSNLSAILVNLSALNVAVNALAPGSVPTPYVITQVTVDIAAANNDKLKCN